MREHYAIVYINILEERHGSTYRARQLARQLSRFYRILYVECNVRGCGLAQAGMDVVSVRRSDSAAGLIRSVGEFFGTYRSLNCDILFLQKPWLITLPCALAAKANGGRIVIDFDDVDSLWQTSIIKRHFAFAGELAMPQLADLLTTHNQHLGGELRQRGYRVALVRQGVDTALFDPARYDKAAEKDRLGLSGYQVLCFLGSFTAGSARDLLPLLEAYREVERARRDVFFLIIGGGGPLEPYFLEQIRRLDIQRLRITGRMDQREVPRHLAAADLGLIYMRDDDANRSRVSFKVLEYLAMDLPVVGRVVGATAELLGRHVLPAEAAGPELSRAIIRALDGRRRPPARQSIVANHDWNRIGDDLRGALGELGR